MRGLYPNQTTRTVQVTTLASAPQSGAHMTTETGTATHVRLAGDALIRLYRHAPGFQARLTRVTWLVASSS